MKHTFLTITLAAQLVAVGAFAQTDTTTAGTTDGSMTSAAFGSDWSPTLGTAMFTEGGSAVRSEQELTTQWQTLSEEDRMIVQRDCMVYMQQSGGTSDTTGDASGSTAPVAAARTAATDGTTESTAPTDGSATDSTATGTASADAGAMMSVSMEQMEQICAATKDF